MKRPPLNEIGLTGFDPSASPQVIVTMSIGQWDEFLAVAYDQGFILIELDAKERPVRAFKRKVQ